MIKPLKLWKQ